MRVAHLVARNALRVHFHDLGRRIQAHEVLDTRRIRIAFEHVDAHVRAGSRNKLLASHKLAK